jgi:ATPase subunit of ABC transporter with duplicated ATPase domains
MSILNVEHLTHGFGDRAILDDVSFRLLKGEHIGLVGANGEGKSTFLNIVTGKLMPDEGKVGEKCAGRLPRPALDTHRGNDD